MKKQLLNRFAVAIILSLIGGATVMGACYHSLYNHLSCRGEGECDSYKTPGPDICRQGDAETGEEFGATITNNVTIYTYSGGYCNGASIYGPGRCAGGTLTGTNPNGIVITDTCKSCSGG